MAGAAATARKALPWVPAAAWAMLLGLALTLPALWQRQPMDVLVYRQAATRMLEGGAELYAPASGAAAEVGPYIYPPLLAVLAAPLAWLPETAFLWAWALLQWVIAVGAFAVVLRICGARAAVGDCPRSWGLSPFLGAKVRQRSVERQHLVRASDTNSSGGDSPTAQAAAPGTVPNREHRTPNIELLLLTAVYGAIWTNFGEGQVNLLLVGFIAGGLWQLEKGNTWRGGLLLAAAAHLKVIPIVLLAVLVVQRRFKACAAMLAGFALLWLAPLVWSLPAHGVDAFGVNVDLTMDYVSNIAGPRVQEQEAGGLGGMRAPNNSLAAVVNRWFGDGDALSLFEDGHAPLLFTAPRWATKWVGFGVGVLLFGAALLLGNRRRESAHARNAAAGLALLAAALGNLLFWPHHLALLLIPLGALAVVAPTRRVWAAAIAVPLVCFVPMLFPGTFVYWVLIWGAPTLCVIAVFATVWWTFWRGIAGANASPILPPDEEANPGNPAA